MTPPVCRADTPVVEVIKQLDRTGAARAVIVTPPPDDAYICQISPNEIRRHLVTGLDANAPIGQVVERSPLFLRERELADPARRGAVVVELQAAGYSHCAIVNADGRFLRAVRCEELLVAGGGPPPPPLPRRAGCAASS